MENRIELTPMTREQMHELYREFTIDRDLFPENMPEKTYTYNPEKVDVLYAMRHGEQNSLCFAVLLDGAVIGEVGLRKIHAPAGSCELSIQLQNDGVKNRGYGTAAERKAVEYAFYGLGLKSVWAETLENNTRSWHVLEKLGFRFEGSKNGYRQYRLERKD